MYGWLVAQCAEERQVYTSQEFAERLSALQAKYAGLEFVAEGRGVVGAYHATGVMSHRCMGSAVGWLTGRGCRVLNHWVTVLTLFTCCLAHRACEVVERPLPDTHHWPATRWQHRWACRVHHHQDGDVPDQQRPASDRRRGEVSWQG